MKFKSLENISLQGPTLEWDPKVGPQGATLKWDPRWDPKLRTRQTGFINENKPVKSNRCKLCNPQFK